MEIRPVNVPPAATPEPRQAPASVVVTGDTPPQTSIRANAVELPGAAQQVRARQSGQVNDVAGQDVKDDKDTRQLTDAVDTINKTLSSMNKGIEFSVDEETRLRVVKVVDKDTKEVVRQFPSEEVIAIAKALDKLQGLLVTDKV
jgi:flagellar protein FlaG